MANTPAAVLKATTGLRAIQSVKPGERTAGVRVAPARRTFCACCVPETGVRAEPAAAAAGGFSELACARGSTGSSVSSAGGPLLLAALCAGSAPEVAASRFFAAFCSALSKRLMT
jgi:hypothetical protein